ncbi:MAG: hypothetical protein N2Z84_04065 [Atribacterota bacterium]|nr:hypothetical protein [Atribacterota bacterium]
MKKWWFIGVGLVVVLFLLSGCGATVPSATGGVTLDVRVLSRTAYQALIQMTLANRSSSSFYFTRAEVAAEICERGGPCGVYSEGVTIPASELLRPGEVWSSQEWVDVADAWSFMRWFEVVFEGRIGGTSVRVSSNRIYL